MAGIELSVLGVATAAVAGAVSFVSPCVLPLVPGYLSYVAGGAEHITGEKPNRLRIVSSALFFILGFVTVFVLLGVSAQALGGLLQRHQTATNLLGGALVASFGLVMTGLLRLPALLGEYRWHGPAQVGGPTGAFLVGLAFGFGWTPCIGPVLGSIFTVTAVSAGNGVVLLGAYGLGLGVPFLVSALLFGRAAVVLKRMRRAGAAINMASGVIMLGIGLLMMTGRLSDIAIWALTTFPSLGRIG